MCCGMSCEPQGSDSGFAVRYDAHIQALISTFTAPTHRATPVICVVNHRCHAPKQLTNQQPCRASQKRMEERQQERARRRAEREQQQTQQPQQQQQRASAVARQGPSGQSAIVIPSLPPGSSKNPLYVRLEVQPDETVRGPLCVYL